jgi:hypothetical protein
MFELRTFFLVVMWHKVESGFECFVNVLCVRASPTIIVKIITEKVQISI